MKPASAILSEIAERKGDRISLGEIVEEAGSRAHGLGLFIFALPEAVPIPMPGVSAVLAIPLVLLSAHLMVFGENARLPARLSRKTLPLATVRKMSSYALPVLKYIDRFVKPRLTVVSERDRLLGGCCLALSLVIVAPIPFGNLVPAVCLALIALGMVQRDGAAVLLGLSLAIGIAAAVYFAANSIKALFGWL